jgi:UPF0755 protein
MRRFLLALLVLLLIAGGVAGWGWRRVTHYLDTPISAQGGETRIEIPKGANFRQVVEILNEADLVTDPLVFEWYGRYEDAGSHIKAGHYLVDRAMTPRQLLDQLRKGSLPAQVRVTIPEGFNRWQIADLLSQAGVVDRNAFLERVERDDLEGRLFPDTYWIKQGASLDEVVRVLTEHFEQIFEELLKAHPDQGALRNDAAAKRRAIVLASMVEKEAQVPGDRPLIARVFLNRLEKGMKLESDPSCVYGPDLYKEKPAPRFCHDPQSLYSTYVIPGLPPTAIANPGRSALEAVLHPASGAGADKLLYFVAKRDGSGAHQFSETLDAHTRAVDHYLKHQ